MKRKITLALHRTTLAGTAIMMLSTCTAQQTGHNLLRSGTQSGLSGKAAQVMVAQDQASYEELFRKVAALELPMPDPPRVDFGSQVVVFAALGEKPTAGYGIQIVSVACEQATLKVKLRSTSPGGDTLAAQVMTNPYVLAAVQRCPGMRTVEFTGEDFTLPNARSPDRERK